MSKRNLVGSVFGILLLLTSTIPVQAGVEADLQHEAHAAIPVSAPKELVDELVLLLKIMAPPECDVSRCVHGIDATTRVMPMHELSREIPAKLTTVLSVDKNSPTDSYLGMVLEFTDPITTESLRVTVIDRGLDGIVDLMIQQSVVADPSALEEKLENKACFSRAPSAACDGSASSNRGGFDLAFYQQSVTNVGSLLRKALMKSGGLKT